MIKGAIEEVDRVPLGLIGVLKGVLGGLRGVTGSMFPSFSK